MIQRDLVNASPETCEYGDHARLVAAKSSMQVHGKIGAEHVFDLIEVGKPRNAIH